MPELIRAAYRRAVRTGAPCYAWSTYARRILADTMPEHDACMGAYIVAYPTGAVHRYTLRADLPNHTGAYGRWDRAGRAIVDRTGAVVTWEDA